MNSRETRGMLLGLIGVMIFSLTLPMTRIVVAELHPLLNGPAARSPPRCRPACCCGGAASRCRPARS